MAQMLVVVNVGYYYHAPVHPKTGPMKLKIMM